MPDLTIDDIAEPASTGTKPKPGKGAGATKLTTQDWVFDLQRKLIDKAKELGVAIDLGKTGKKKDGIDGVYAGKTKGAVKAIAAKLGIKDPLDKSGLPTQEFKDKIGFTATSSAPGATSPPVAGTAPSPAPGAPPAPGETAKAVEPAVVMKGVPVDGKNFSMGALIGNLPPSLAMKTEGGQEVRLSAAEALSRMVMIREAVVAGGLPGGPEIPDVYSIRAKEGYLKAAESLTQTKAALDNSLAKLDDAVSAEIARKRKEKGLPEAFSSGATQEAYKAEFAMSRLPNAIQQGLGVAYKWLYVYLKEMGGGDRTNPQSLLAVMKRNTDVASYANFPHAEFDNTQADAVGRVLLEVGGDLGARIDPKRPSQYFQGSDDSSDIDEEWREAFTTYADRLEPIIKRQRRS